MIYVELNAANEITAIHSEHVKGAQCRWDWKSFDVAEKLAAKITKFTGALHIATDSGPSVSPRFDIIKAPAVGDEASYAFNGDYYPCGKIKSISKSLRVITTDTGRTFYRRRQSGAWIMKGGTWSLVHGHINRLNPEF